MINKYSIPLSEKQKRRPRILLLGGYGYGNVGDEAQLSADLELLEKIAGRDCLKVLSPNPDYTGLQHDGVASTLAPREAFFDQSSSPLYKIRTRASGSSVKRIGNAVYKLLFLLRMLWLLANAWLIKVGLPPVLLGTKRIALLEEVRKSDLIFFVGGGYLTGATLSRLWDGMLFIRIASLFGKRVFISGQTIGDWQSSFNRWIAKWGLKKADLITVRDPEDSFQALLELGLDKSKFYASCDDALFCSRTEINAVPHDQAVLGSRYIAFHLHYWGANTADQQERILDYAVQILEQIPDENVVVISMTPSDEQAMADLERRYPRENISYFQYNYDYELMRAVLAEAAYCITMKHHPIIFSLGEETPVITVNYTDYYEHKNAGALRIFGLERYSVRIERDPASKVGELIQEINSDREKIQFGIRRRLVELKELRQEFFDTVEGALK
jgi:polysaccharide pyruvyl transferase WcaK-like protein